VERVFDTKVFADNVWGLQWFNSDLSPKGNFPQYFKSVGEERVAVAAADVPAETRLPEQEFKQAGQGAPYTSPAPAPGAGPAETRTAHSQTHRWFPGDILLVPFCRSAFLSAIWLEREEEGEVAGARRENPCPLAD